MAEKRDVTVHVIHVAAGKAAARRFEQDVAQRLAEVSAGDFDVRMDVLTAKRPAEVILEHAQRLDVDAIFMGKHGSRTTDRLLTYLGAYGQVIGTTAEYVVRTADRPVLLTSPRFVHGPLDIRRVLVAIDFSTHTPSAIRLGRELGSMFDAEVEFIHVRNGSASIIPPDAELDSTPIDFCRFIVRRGQVDRTVVERVRERGIDLLVINSHGQTSDRRARLGEVADKLIRSAPCSVLTVKSFGKALVTPASEDRELASRFLSEITAPL
ncbi:MAG: universal stress protein, partial [Rhodothermales bacterium]|nr:universal stress protein [Rhodothermales bacterium]